MVGQGDGLIPLESWRARREDVVPLTWLGGLAILLGCAGLGLLVGVVVWTLITFANPFSTGDGTAVQADDLTGTVERLRDTYSGPAWQPCPARPP